MNIRCLLTAVLLTLVCLTHLHAEPQATEQSPPTWDLAVLGKAPKFVPANEPTVDGLEAIFFDGVPFQNKPTKVFAYYGLPKNIKKGEKVPGMVLIHGGGGSAYADWVRLWNSRGYAAIAADNYGCVPIGRPGKWQRNEAGGPGGGDAFRIDWPQRDQWTWQAVANTLLAHSLLRGLPEVDPERIGVTGLSWGGYLTCIVSGVDPRFQFAVPVYGCGYLGDNSHWLPTFANLGPERASRWLRWWDPSVYLKQTTMPILWVTGTNDFAYPMDSLQKSYHTVQGPHALCVKIRMPHSQPAGSTAPEVYAFAESMVNGGIPLAKIREQGRNGNQVWATYDSKRPIRRVELNYTCQSGKWQDRLWKTAPGQVDEAQSKVTARLPAGVAVYYLNLIDDRDLAVSTEHEVIETAGVASLGPAKK